MKTSVQTSAVKKVVKYHAFSQVRSAKKHGKRILIWPSLTLCIDFFILSRPLKRKGQLSLLYVPNYVTFSLGKGQVRKDKRLNSVAM